MCTANYFMIWFWNGGSSVEPVFIKFLVHTSTDSLRFVDMLALSWRGIIYMIFMLDETYIYYNFMVN